MDRINTAFDAFIAPDTYQRVDGVHPLDLYIGIDDRYRWTLLLICDIEPPAMDSSRMIAMQKGKRTDGRWAVSLSLVDPEYKGIFLLFCGDIIDSSRMMSSKKEAVKFIARRYKEWREMLANSPREILSPSEIKGLLGEMYFLHSYLSVRYGIDNAVLSWTGPRKLPQDFIIDDTWYEIKTISSGRAEVGISSIEQLDCSNAGELVIIYADKTSLTNERAINLNQVYQQLLERIQDDNVKTEFSNMLFRYGYYPRQEYETSEYAFEVKETIRFDVAGDFPCLHRSEMPKSVVQAEYTISLPAIKDFRKE